MTNQSELRAFVWQACTAIRNEHRDVKKYVEYTALLLFFKFYDDLFDTLPTDIQGLIPEQYRWKTLKGLDPRGFGGYHSDVLVRFREFFEGKKWRGKKTFGKIFETFQFDIKHDEVLGRALNALDRINFAGMAYDQKGDIYEFLIAKMADAGVKGEFFTPRPIVNMVIDLLQPRMGMRVWDPACGTGGFLSRAFEQMAADLRRQYPEGTKRYAEGLEQLRTSLIFGNETEAVSARLARMNMILRGDGHSTILEFNSLDQQTYSLKRLDNRGAKEDNPIPAILEGGGFDFIMANPPYGGSQAVCDVGSTFKPWQKSKKPEANFLQVMMAALKPGGSCGVLMPEGILFRRDERRIRERLLKEFDLQAVIGLFKGAFEFAEVKASVLLFRRPTKAERWLGTKKVWIAETRDFEDINSVAARFAARTEDELARNLGIAEIKRNQGVLRPGKYLKVTFQSQVELVPLSELFEEAIENITLDDNTSYKQVRVRYHGKGACLRREVQGAEVATKRQHIAHAGYLIVSKIDARYGAIAIVPKDLDGAIVSQDFPVFRPKSDSLSPRLLWYFLRFGPLAQHVDAQGTTNRQRITADDLLAMLVPCPTPGKQRELIERLSAQEQVFKRAELLLNEVYRLNWIDDSTFLVPEADILARSFEPLVEDASEYVDPREQPDKEWQLYTLTNSDGAYPGDKKLGAKFARGRKYKRVVENTVAYDTRRVNVGSVAILPKPVDPETSIISPYRVMFRCKPDLNPRFALYLIKSPYFRRLIKEAQVGAIRDELFLSVFTEIEVPIPARPVQDRIVADIEEQLASYAQVSAIRDHAEQSIRSVVMDLFGITPIIDPPTAEAVAMEA